MKHSWSIIEENEDNGVITLKFIFTQSQRGCA